MNIVHLVVTDAFAGVERHVATLAAQQFDQGHAVVVLGCDGAQLRQAVGARPIGHRAAPRLGAALSSLARVPHPDILHAHMTAAEIATAIQPRHLGVPVVATRHFAQRRGSSSPARLVARLAARRIDAQIAVSRYVADHVEGECVVIPAGVPARPLPDPAEREPVVLVAQRLEEEKAGDVAIRAFASAGLGGQWRLAIAGAGGLQVRLRDLAADLGIGERTDFLGHRTDVDALMRRSAMLLAPCPAEGLGIAVLEAMSHGLPVIAAAAGGHLETVGSAAGAKLFPPGEADAAAEHLVRLAADPGERAAYGSRLWQVQRETFTPQRQAADVERVYRSVL